MMTTRREFIGKAGLIGSGLLLGTAVIGRNAGKETFLSGIGVCTDIRNAGIFAAAGYSYIEEGVRRFLVPSQSERSFDQNLAVARKAALPVESCNGFLPGELKSVGPEAVHPEILRFAEIAFRRGRKAGVKTIVFGSGVSRSIPDGFQREKAEQQFMDLCRKMGIIAEKYDMVVSIEPLNSGECNFINSVAEGGKLVEEINHPNIRLLADLYHMKVEKEDPQDLVRYGHLLFHTHIAEEKNRAAPGVNGEDFSPWFSALRQSGFKGRMSVECRWKDQSIEAAPALQTIKSYL